MLFGRFYRRNQMTKLTKLPHDVLNELQEEIRVNFYSHNEAISDWLKEKGYNIGKSTIHRYSQALKRLDGFTAKSQTHNLLAEVTTENFDRPRLSSLYRKLGKLEHEKQKILTQINQLQDEEKA